MITETPGEPPTYVLPGGVRLYGLGPPAPPRPRLPTPARLGAFLKELVPDAFAVEVADRWGRDGLTIRVVHLATGARAWAVLRRPTELDRDHVGAAVEALDEALARLRNSSSNALPPS
ncbi:MAG TPA: hypothetical protein VFS43_41130 [Polyangiaceae bacterium]|nr:hypothetical protein [Polyangiaceae bacterium]